jgi:hypothetical protein
MVVVGNIKVPVSVFELIGTPPIKIVFSDTCKSPTHKLANGNSGLPKSTPPTLIILGFGK